MLMVGILSTMMTETPVTELAPQRQRRYGTDLTDAEWQIIAPFLAPKAGPGAPRTVETRAVVDAIFYKLRTGCQWRYLPEDYGPWSTVSYYFYQWRDDGTWGVVLDVLRRAERRRQGRHPEPSGLLLDSQSVKTTEKGGRVATTPASTSAAASGTC